MLSRVELLVGPLLGVWLVALAAYVPLGAAAVALTRYFSFVGPFVAIVSLGFLPMRVLPERGDVWWIPNDCRILDTSVGDRCAGPIR